MNSSQLASRLVTNLQALDNLSTHLQHAVVRVARAASVFASAISATTATLSREGALESATRLRGRLEELEAALRDPEELSLGTGTGGEAAEQATAELVKLAEQAKTARELLEKDIQSFTRDHLPTGNGASSSHSRTPSVDLPRKVPATSSTLPPSTIDHKAASDSLEAFVSSLLTPSDPSPKSTKPHPLTAALGQAFMLRVFATSPEHTAFKVDEPVSTLFRGPSSSDPIPATPPTDDLAGLWSIVSSLIPEERDPESDSLDRASLAHIFSKASSTTDPVPAQTALQALLITFHDQCSPARDEQIKSLLSRLQVKEAITEATLRDVASGTIELARGMREDVHRFGVKNFGPGQEDARGKLSQLMAQGSELDAVELAEKDIKGTTLRWVETATEASSTNDDDDLWRRIHVGLLHSVFSEIPVSIPFTKGHPDFTPPPLPRPIVEGAPPNYLPPIFYVPQPLIFELQNHLQALVILACLATLVPAPPQPPPSSSSLPSSASAAGPTLYDRLWTILKAAGDNTKLVHLSDELIKSRGTSVGEAEQKRVREGVNRILRYEDPAFKLLRKRLKEGLESVAGFGLEDDVQGRGLPGRMSSGRARGNGGGSSTPRRGEVKVPVVRGFERIKDKVEEVAEEARGYVSWARELWDGRLRSE